MPTIFDQIYWCFLKTFTWWTSNSKTETEDSGSHFAVIALFGHQQSEMVLWPIQHCFSRVSGEYTGFQEEVVTAKDFFFWATNTFSELEHNSTDKKHLKQLEFSRNVTC